jgi:amino acid transporter
MSPALRARTTDSVATLARTPATGGSMTDVSPSSSGDRTASSGGIVDKGLKHNAVSFKDSVVIGLASTAPAYSIAATLGYIILEVGERAPAAIILAFIPMLFTSFAYRELNRVAPDAGTTFTWATKAFGPWAGWMGGWAVAFAGTIFLASAGEVAASYFYDAIGLDSLVDNRAAVVIGGVLVIVAMAWVSYRGIDISKRMQDILIVLQFGALAVFAGSLLYFGLRDEPEGGVTPSFEMVNIFGFDDRTTLVSAVVLAVFLFWGWESTLSINEETQGSASVPGKSAVTSTVILLATYIVLAIAVITYGGVGEGILDFSDEAVDSGVVDDVLTPLGQAAIPGIIWLVLLAIVVSALSSTQTTILPTTRGTLAMAVYHALPARFASVNPKYLSPSFSTFLMAGVAIVYYVVMSIVSTDVLSDTITSIGLSITFYYSLTGLACAWYFRHELRSSFRNLMMRGVLPVVGAIALAAVFVQSAIIYSEPGESVTTIGGIGTAFVVGIGSLVLGAVLMIVWSFFAEAKPFFRGESLKHDTPVLVPEGEQTPTDARKRRTTEQRPD